MIKCVTLLLLLSALFCRYPVPAYAGNAVRNEETTHLILEKKAGLSDKKIRKINRLRAKLLSKLTSDLPDRYIWIGLFGLGLALCLSFFSVTLGGIVAAASVACLIIGGIFKLSTL